LLEREGNRDSKKCLDAKEDEDQKSVGEVAMASRKIKKSPRGGKKEPVPLPRIGGARGGKPRKKHNRLKKVHALSN